MPSWWLCLGVVALAGCNDILQIHDRDPRPPPPVDGSASTATAGGTDPGGAPPISGAAAGGAGTGDAGGSGGAPNYKIVFVSSMQVTVDTPQFNSIASADALCQTL